MADKENGFVLGFFEEFLEEYMPPNSSYFVVSERHSGGIIKSVISLRGKRSRAAREGGGELLKGMCFRHSAY